MIDKGLERWITGGGTAGKGFSWWSLCVPIARSLEQFPRAVGGDGFTLGGSPNLLSIFGELLGLVPPHLAANDALLAVGQRGVGKGDLGWSQRRRAGGEEKEEQEDEQKEKHKFPSCW